MEESINIVMRLGAMIVATFLVLLGVHAIRVILYSMESTVEETKVLSEESVAYQEQSAEPMYFVYDEEGNIVGVQTDTGYSSVVVNNMVDNSVTNNVENTNNISGNVYNAESIDDLIVKDNSTGIIVVIVAIIIAATIIACKYLSFKAKEKEREHIEALTEIAIKSKEQEV